MKRIVVFETDTHIHTQDVTGLADKMTDEQLVDASRLFVSLNRMMGRDVVVIDADAVNVHEIKEVYIQKY